VKGHDLCVPIRRSRDPCKNARSAVSRSFNRLCRGARVKNRPSAGWMVRATPEGGSPAAVLLTPDFAGACADGTATIVRRDQCSGIGRNSKQRFILRGTR